jgi:signal transduction histidine kinase
MKDVIPAGELAVLPVGVGVVAVVLVATMLSTWWAVGTEQRGREIQQQAELAALAKTLSEALRPLVVHEDLAAVRRTLVETKDAFGLSVCELALPDGRVLADGDPSRIRVQALPARWGNQPLDAEKAPTEPGQQQFLVMIPGRGTLVGTVGVAAPARIWAPSEMQTGLSLIGAAGAGAMLMVYRRMRSRVGVMGMIQESLRLTRAGVQEAQALTLAANFGPDAEAWNALIEERERLRTGSLAARTRELLGAVSGTHANLESACNALGEGLILVGGDGTVRFANGAAAGFLGVETLAGGPLSPHLKELALQQALEQTLRANSQQRRTVEVETKDGQNATVLRYDLRPVRRPDGIEVLVVIYDVTQQRVSDASRNAFVAHVTHELRTPLTSIRLYLETAATDGENDPAIRAKCLNVILQESRRLEHVVSEMLSASEIEAGAMQLNWDDVRLDALFAGLKADYEGLAQEKKLQFLFEMPPKYPVIRADRERLSLALHNMIGNAIKYTPAGGAVKIALRVEGRQILVDVVDTGIGIDEKEQEKVFERFYRSKDPRVLKITGSGLGLALARDIVRLHGGDITLQSQINKGSTFTLTLTGGAERRTDAH